MTLEIRHCAGLPHERSHVCYGCQSCRLGLSKPPIHDDRHRTVGFGVLPPGVWSCFSLIVLCHPPNSKTFFVTFLKIKCI